MREIIQRVVQGDVELFRHIVREYGPAVRAFLASRLAGQAQDVDDLSQETFIAAYECLSSFDPEKDFSAWIRGIARNKLNMHLRRRYAHADAMEQARAEITLLMDEEVEKCSESCESDEILRLRKCLEKLPVRMRNIFQSRYFNGKRVCDIARSLATSVTAISNALFHGRQQLRDCMENPQ